MQLAEFQEMKKTYIVKSYISGNSGRTREKEFRTMGGAINYQTNLRRIGIESTVFVEVPNDQIAKGGK